MAVFKCPSSESRSRRRLALTLFFPPDFSVLPSVRIPGQPSASPGPRPLCPGLPSRPGRHCRLRLLPGAAQRRQAALLQLSPLLPGHQIRGPGTQNVCPGVAQLCRVKKLKNRNKNIKRQKKI